MFGIFATIKIKPDQHEQFLITIRETARRSVESEPGCLRFDVFQDLADQIATFCMRFIRARMHFKNIWALRMLGTQWKSHGDWAAGGFEVTRATSVYPNTEGYFITPKVEQ